MRGIFFANASDGPYSNERSGVSVKTARENGERDIFCEHEQWTIFERSGASVKTARENCVRLACFTLEDHAYRASHLLKTTVLQSSSIIVITDPLQLNTVQLVTLSCSLLLFAPVSGA